MCDKIIDYIENQEGNNFKQTEIGLIPKDWEVVKLEDLINEIISGDWGVDEKENKDGFLKCLVVRGTDFLNFKKRIFSGIPKRLIKESSFKKRALKSGDLLIEISGGSKKQPTGRVFYINKYLLEKSSIPLLFTNFVKLIRVKEETILSEYLWRYWQYLYDKGITRIYEKRTTGIRNFKYKDFLCNEIIPLPPQLEQKKIARVLRKIQQAIEQQDKIIEATKNLKKSLIQKLFTEGVINGFMFDTNIFNHILDNKILIENFPENLNLFITHIQLDELEKTRDQNRRKMLLTIFKKIDQENIPTESLVLSVSKLGKAKLGDEDGLYKKIKLDLDEKVLKRNNKQDALIAKTTIKNGLILVTDDSDLLEVTQKYNGEVITLKGFLSGNYRKLKETEIGLIPKNWEVVEFENAILKRRKKIGKVKQQEYKKAGKCPVIDQSKNYIAGYTDEEDKLYQGDLPVVIFGDHTRVFKFVDFPFVAGADGVKIIIPNINKFKPKFFYYTTLNLKIKSRGYNRHYSLLRKKKVSLPPFSEQKRIVNILSIVDKKIELEESRKSILKELFKTMLHKLMTSEIGLKDIEV